MDSINSAQAPKNSSPSCFFRVLQGGLKACIDGIGLIMVQNDAEKTFVGVPGVGRLLNEHLPDSVNCPSSAKSKAC